MSPVCAEIVQNGGEPRHQSSDEIPGASPGASQRNGVAPIYVADIEIRRGDVFDLSKPEENIAIYRFANRIHYRTRESVIRKLLLFKTGDPFNPRLLEESERILRANKYIYEASVRVRAYHGDTVDILVQTRDAWTLTGSVNYSRLGGADRYGFELEETNLVGYGKELKLKHKSNVDRQEDILHYKDNQLLGSNANLSLDYIDKSDGLTYEFILEKPFHSLDSKWSLGFVAFNDERTDFLYEFGEVINEYNHQAENYGIFGGLSDGYIDSFVYRWRYGLSKNSDYFAATEGTVAGVPLPEDKNLVYPWIGLSVTEDRMIKTRQVRHIQRTEDINLGNNVEFSLGWSDEQFGATENSAIFSVKAASVFTMSHRHMMMVSAESGGRVSDGKGKSIISKFMAEYFLPNFDSNVFYMALSGEYGVNLDANEQITLGGDSGLRGYPLRYQDGDRKFLLTFEQRHYTQWHWFQLFHVGALVFADVGRAWFPQEQRQGTSDILGDVGLGLRITSSRGARGIVLHLDLAFPLNGDDSIDDVQFLVTSSEFF